VEVVRALLEGGADVERCNADTHNALHGAAAIGHLEVCRLLLDYGADVNALDNMKHTPLYWAANGGDLATVKLLVARGADVTFREVDGRTARDRARDKGHKDVADYLGTVSRM
jgi:ankyrin repeat protein